MSCISCNFCIQRKSHPIDDDDDSSIETEPKRSLVTILSKCDKEDIPELSIIKQPPFIEPINDRIKCNWCPGWTGSSQTKRINQHVRKAVSHKQARTRELNLPTCQCPESSSQGVQLDIRSFF